MKTEESYTLKVKVRKETTYIEDSEESYSNFRKRQERRRDEKRF